MGKRDVYLENKHHNVPGSRGGSGKEINLSVIPERRHGQFHVWSWNRTPEMLIRKMILRAIGLEGKHALPPSALEDLFGAMSVPDWTDLYDPDAVIWLCGKGDREHALKAHDYAVEHLIEELTDNRSTINALLHGRYFPVFEEEGNAEFLQQALQFFGTHSPREAVQHLLTEEHKGALIWVKPLRTGIREQLLTVIQSAKPVFLDAKEQDRLVGMLQEHEMYLVSSIIHERSH